MPYALCSMLHLRGLSFGYKLIHLGPGPARDLPEYPHRLPFAMQHQGHPCLGHAHLLGQPLLGKIVFAHDALNFFCHIGLS